LAGKWARWSVLLLVTVLVQIVYWGVWPSSALGPPQRPAQTSGAEEEVEFGRASRMALQQIAAWEMPREWLDVDGRVDLENMHPYWMELEALAAAQGLGVEYEVLGERVDWRLQGDYAELMIWLHELITAHPRLVMQRLSLSPIDPGTMVKAHIQMGMQEPPVADFGLGLQAPAPFELPVLSSIPMPHSKPDMGLSALDVNAAVSPFGLAPWFDALAYDWWWNEETTDRLSALQRLPLNHIQWVGSMIKEGRAVALLSAGGRIWRVSRGDRVGTGLSRVVDIQVNQVVIEELTPYGNGQLLRSTVVLAAQSN
jgi:hypothetical protein